MPDDYSGAAGRSHASPASTIRAAAAMMLHFCVRDRKIPQDSRFHPDSFVLSAGTGMPPHFW